MTELEKAETEYFEALVEWGAALKKYLERVVCEVEL